MLCEVDGPRSVIAEQNRTMAGLDGGGWGGSERRSAKATV